MGDVGDAGAGESLIGELVEGGFEDPLAAAFGVALPSILGGRLAAAAAPLWAQDASWPCEAGYSPRSVMSPVRLTISNEQLTDSYERVRYALVNSIQNCPTERRLRVRRGLGDANIVVAEKMDDLYTAHCTGRPPKARLRQRQRRAHLPAPLASPSAARRCHYLQRRHPVADGHRRGVGNVTADLTGILLRHRPRRRRHHPTRIDHSAPQGTLPVRLGSVNRVTIRRPRGAAVRVTVRRVTTELTVDDRSSVPWAMRPPS